MLADRLLRELRAPGNLGMFRFRSTQLFYGVKVDQLDRNDWYSSVAAQSLQWYVYGYTQR